MRVLAAGNLYPPHHLGGYEVVWRGVMRQLCAEGHQTRILSTHHREAHVAGDEPEDADVHRELEWYWRDHAWLELKPLQRLALERRNAAIFDRHLREFRPHVITWWALGGMSLSLIERARRRAIPAVLFVHDYWPVYGPQRDLWTRMWATRPRAAAIVERIVGIPTRLQLEHAGRWLFCSATLANEIRRTGLDVSNSAVLQPGIEDAYLDAPSETEPRAWDWRLLYIGRVVEQKGVDTAIESLPLLPENATLTILGDGDQPYRQTLEQLADRLRVSDRVRFEPRRSGSEVFEFYRGADAIVFPVRWPEPWGLVPLEAMALGRPVLATGTGGSREYLAHERNSLLFAPGDAAALAGAFRRLAQDSALRERLRAGGLQTAARHSESVFNEQAVREITNLVR